MHTPLPAETSLGTATLRVRDLARANQFYRDMLGLGIEAGGTGSKLFAQDRHVLTLEANPSAMPKPREAAGLFHVAILLPDRAALGATFRHLVRQGIRLGASDHLVSEALYLDDPDGNGIEIYADRPRDSWRWSDGEIAMATEPLDVENLLADAGPEEEIFRLPSGTRIGHIHLQVGDLQQARGFYSGVLGFDVTTEDYPGALFMSAGGYHHHIAVNVWRSRGAATVPAGTAGLASFEIRLPEAAMPALRQRLQSAGLSGTDTGGGLAVTDPWGTAIHIVPD